MSINNKIILVIVLEYNQRIKNIREDNDIKQIDVANYLECEKDRYVKWENGLNNIPLEYVVKLSQFYQVSISYLLGVTEEKGTASLITFDASKVSANIRNLRKQHSELQKDLAYLLNCSVDSISNYERTKDIIPIEKALKLCEHYNVTIEELLS